MWVPLWHFMLRCALELLSTPPAPPSRHSPPTTLRPRRRTDTQPNEKCNTPDTARMTRNVPHTVVVCVRSPRLCTVVGKESFANFVQQNHLETFASPTIIARPLHHASPSHSSAWRTLTGGVFTMIKYRAHHVMWFLCGVMDVVEVALSTRMLWRQSLMKLSVPCVIANSFLCVPHKSVSVTVAVCRVRVKETSVRGTFARFECSVDTEILF